MVKKKSKIALIARDPESRKFYKSLLSSYSEISLDEYQSIHQFKSSGEKKSCSGVLVDVRTHIGATMEEKEFFFMISGKLPILNVNQTFNKNGFSCYIEGEGPSNLKGKEALDHFIKKYIQSSSLEAEIGS